MIDQGQLALFLMLGQTGEKTISVLPDVAPAETLQISDSYDLATFMPVSVRNAISAADAYKLLFVFEEYLRNFVVDVLTTEDSPDWWSKVPPDVKKEVEELEATEEAKNWMALGSRGKASLLTYPQLLHVIDQCWKQGFEDVIRDKALISESRLLSHLRNTICHMTCIPEEEVNRIRQTMRDWFRVISP